MLSLVLLSWAQEVQQGGAPRPPPLLPLPRCDNWKGTASGNDPSVEVSLRICPVEGKGSAVEGTLVWSSLTSGWNRRDVVGSWEGPRLLLRDLRVAEERPQPGWYFCVIDRYELEKVGPSTLSGRYDSAACMDHATLKLARVGTAAPLKEAEKVVEKPWYRGCSHAPGVGGWALWLGVAVLWRRRNSPEKSPS
ncbi:MAG TPA: hypothetical protein PLA94_32140 [Myxococcota bacterium]|nr:hypothetical protein [Myxococcota bacterium]